ncbi:M1-specific T cell receptor beta chain-like [Protopterus annectens]|uniref:M1-specific T cell receptor beta chain-like n=1 Tax=Protopterus annectens TaxID=7888 RepID=UPI001CFA1283|nr:M1-specific T cell receptor beta chain-like [Protopterus annectens]
MKMCSGEFLPAFAMMLLSLYLLLSFTDGLVESWNTSKQFASDGDNVSIPCPSTKNNDINYQARLWYIQIEGGDLHFLTNCSKNAGKNQRISCGAYGKQYILRISPVRKNDSGTYYCVSSVKDISAEDAGYSLHVRDPVKLVILQNQEFHFAKDNDSVEIQCRFHGQLPEAERHRYLSWYKQTMKGLLLFISNCSSEPTVHQRISCKVGTNVFSLKISPAQQSDSRKYYCASSFPYYLSLGVGSYLVVGDTFTTKTSVLILTPPSETIMARHSVPLVCLVTGIRSATVHISWNVSGSLMEGLHSSVRENQETFSIRSQITIPAADWTSGILCTCQVQFNSSGTPIQKTVSFKRVYNIVNYFK